MKQQQGAALVIVMALLSGALMLGMSGMQSALIDERLAGNYRASVQSQMAGESFLSDIVRDENSDVLTSIINQVMESENNTPVTVDDEQLNALMEELSVEIEVTRQDNQITIKAWGSEGRAKAPSVLVFNASGAAENYRAPFIACQRMRITGRSLAASCHSSNGACSSGQSNLIPAESQKYNLLYSLGSEQGSSITLDVNSQAYGNVRSQRDIFLAGSSRIIGSAYAQSAICYVNGMDCDSAASFVDGDEVITTGRLQQCDMFLDLASLNNEIRDISLGYNSSVRNVVMGGQRRQWALTPEGLFYSDCGFLGLGCIFSEFLEFFIGFDRDEWVKYSSVINNTIVVDDFFVRGNSTFIVASNQNRLARLRMVVEGDFIIEERGNELVIEDNAQLEIFVKGKTILNPNLQMGEGSVSRNGQTPLTINSSYSGAGDAVAVNSGSHVVGNIYAPGGRVSVNSSRVTGSIWAQEINALNDSQIIYNEANVVADSQAIESETANEGGSGFNWQWR